jgi:hypothetical protein
MDRCFLITSATCINSPATSLQQTAAASLRKDVGGCAQGFWSCWTACRSRFGEPVPQPAQKSANICKLDPLGLGPTACPGNCPRTLPWHPRITKASHEIICSCYRGGWPRVRFIFACICHVSKNGESITHCCIPGHTNAWITCSQHRGEAF